MIMAGINSESEVGGESLETEGASLPIHTGNCASWVHAFDPNTLDAVAG